LTTFLGIFPRFPGIDWLGLYFVLRKSANPNISRVRGVHLQGIQGRSRSRLLQALDNDAKRRLGNTRRVKIFKKLKKNNFRYKLSS